MDILGLRIGRGKDGTISIKRAPTRIVIADRVPEIKVSIPDTKKPTMIPPVRNPVLRYNSDRYRGRGQFHQAEYDLAEAGRIEDTDSYVRQAFDKKVALMFKEGWDIVGKNPRTVKYIKARFSQIARASGTPTEKLFREVGSSLVRKSNAFLVKVRKTEASGGRVRREPGKDATIKPVAAYFISPAESMEYQLSGGKLSRWQQRMPDGSKKEWNNKDICHFYYDRKDGFIFGTPTLVPVVDDIRALRKIEENIELLVYQHLFPLFQYKVGTEDAPAGFDEYGNREIDLVKQEIQYMPTEGGIVTPERHEIKAIGAEGRALRAEGYLEHFKKRVFAGLGISAVDMGEGETANRATADNMSRNLVDAVKDLQQVMEIFVNDLIITELLLESTFGDSVLDEENICRLKFKEIDIEAQIKKEAHYADQFAKDVLTWDEARTKIGYDPIIVPTPEEAENGNDNPDLYPEWHKTRWKLFEEPKLLIQSIDEPYSLAAKAAVANNSIGVTGQQAQESGDEKKQLEVDLEKEKTKAKVAVAKAKPAPKKRDGYLAETFKSIKEDVVTRAAQPEFDVEWVASQIRTAMAPTIDRLVAEQMVAFRAGYVHHGRIDGETFMKDAKIARGKFRSRTEKYINKLTNNVITGIKKQPDSLGSQDLAMRVRAIFDVVQFRTTFIEDVEVRKAQSLGMATAKKQWGGGHIYSAITNDAACTTCKSMDGKPYDVQNVVMDDLAPHHAGCNCSVSFVDSGSITIGDSLIRDKSDAEDPSPVVPEKEFHECPKCGKTAIRLKDMPNIYKCRACQTSFSIEKTQTSDTPDDQTAPEDLPEFSSMDDNLTDGAKLEECVMSVKADLRKRHPDWSPEKVKASAFAICNARTKGKK